MSDPQPLPVAWDGVPVKWGPWEPAPHIFICPPPEPTPCPGCGIITTRSTSRGRRVYTGNVRALFKNPGVLIAHRCTRCGHDSVLDERGLLWDLDFTDYGPDGSWSVSGRTPG